MTQRGTSDSGVDDRWDLKLPPEWKTSEWRAAAPMGELELPNGRRALLISVLLVDGSSVNALIYPGGQRLARTSPHNDWATEERYVGRAPTGVAARRIKHAWKVVLESMTWAREAAADPTRDDMAMVAKELDRYGLQPGEGWDRRGAVRRDG